MEARALLWEFFGLYRPDLLVLVVAICIGASVAGWVFTRSQN